MECRGYSKQTAELTALVWSRRFPKLRYFMLRERAVAPDFGFVVLTEETAERWRVSTAPERWEPWGTFQNGSLLIEP